MTRSYNQHLSPLPSDDEFVRAVTEIVAEGTLRNPFYRGASAADVAYRLGVQGSSRLGNGAVKGSWSGRMSPALRVTPRLMALAKQGRIFRGYDYDYRRAVYYPNQ